ncbi:D-alanine--poly(phosphoribitol) ligase subunit 2 [Clostridium algifaecis]|uniref:D-alanyl carrier protein n=1 Tax=Clostridium algifaecis TaxID=1472040 RepID=A0ABS4KPY4_9CLOT|nr:D-alanine--poly(phosphoribitol) ligase subunit DltC [Clostridium algifaecis]MBP2032095.1 D-alanine--poly(phosphoribitol) ligase subunit 2 [Clostridium algifaecis]
MQEKLLEILEGVCGTDEVRNDLDLDLFEDGLLDSLGVIELLLSIEDNLKISIQPTEVTREQISTPRKIINYLETKKGE